ncbi:MAG: alpha/beta hydrolase [Alphaproteobacteria bacterium]|nr:alpha/beta hydrolase [Alphaproteobacteria bacterium]
MTQTFAVDVPGARLAGEISGRGPAVVFLHAGLADLRMWRTQMERLAADRQVIAYDRRGFGRTRASSQVFSHVDDLEAVLDHFGLRSATLVGCSQGGRIAIDFALVHPERVSALALVAPAVTGAPSPATFPPGLAERIEELEHAEEDHDFDRMNELEAWVWLDGPTSREGRVSGELRELFLDMNAIALHHPEIEERPRPPAMPRLGQLNMPTLVIWGNLDFEHIQRRSAEIAATVEKGEAFLVEGTAHLPMLEKPDVFNARLSRFLQSIAA